MEEEAYKYFDRIESAGGLLKAIKTGYLQREIAENSYRLSKRVEEGRGPRRGGQQVLEG